ncbi:MAG: undecaprenyl-diphosphatase UppP [bacterium]|nr:undecaprenyl-diphosphatase UppP [bacterium]
MSWLDSVILGVLQGITEFLPISSSGHLIFGEHFLGLNVESLKSFDVVVHMGTLLAILVYFWQDVKGMILALFKVKTDDPYFRLIGFIVIATIPAVIVGLYGEEFLDNKFRNVDSVALWMIILGVIFLFGEFIYKKVHGSAKNKEILSLSWRKVIIIGFAQAIAIIPGVSRSGSTIVAGLFQGVNRSTAARFSFLLGIPAIAGAGLLTGLKSIGDPSGIAFLPLVIGFATSFAFGLLSVHFLMRFLKTHTLRVFAVYLVILGLIVYI